MAAEDGIALTLATATPGGGFPLYGGVVAETVTATDPLLRIATRGSAGSTENIRLLEAGAADLGLVQGEVVHEAFAGIGRPKTRLAIIAAMYPTAGMFAVRPDSRYYGIVDLVGERVAFGARGSGLVHLARYVLDGLNLDTEKHFTPIYLDRAGDGPAMVLDGRAAALWGGGIGWPGFVAITVGAGGARFIVPTAEEASHILGKYPFLRPLTVPPGSYPGQDQAIVSVGSWSFVMARTDLPEEAGYRLARALHRSERVLAARLPQARETTAANTAAVVPRAALHAGVARYLSEIGLLA